MKSLGFIPRWLQSQASAVHDGRSLTFACQLLHIPNETSTSTANLGEAALVHIKIGSPQRFEMSTVI